MYFIQNSNIWLELWKIMQFCHLSLCIAKHGVQISMSTLYICFRSPCCSFGAKNKWNFIFISVLVRDKCSNEVNNCVVRACTARDPDGEMWLPAAHDGDSNKGNNEDHSGCRWTRNQRKLLPQLRLEVICVTQRERQTDRQGVGLRWSFCSMTVCI